MVCDRLPLGLQWHLLPSKQAILICWHGGFLYSSVGLGCNGGDLIFGDERVAPKPLALILRPGSKIPGHYFLVRRRITLTSRHVSLTPRCISLIRRRASLVPRCVSLVPRNGSVPCHSLPNSVKQCQFVPILVTPRQPRSEFGRGTLRRS